MEVYMSAFKVMGIFPFSYKCGRVSLSVIASSWSLAIAVGHIAWVSFYYVRRRMDGANYYSEQISRAPSLALVLTPLVSTGALVWKREKVRRAFDALSDLQNAPSCGRTAVDVKKQWACLVLDFAALVLQVIYTREDVVIRLLCLITLAYRSFSVYLQSMIVDTLTYYVQRLSGEINSSLGRDRLEEILILYDNLADCCNDINASFGAGFMMLILTDFVFAMSILYQIASYTIDTHFIYSTWMVMLVSHVLLLVQSGTALKRAGEEFVNRVRHATVHDKNVGISRCPVITLVVTAPRKFAMSACGFFDVDINVLRSMLIYGTSYLVILVQMNPNRSAENQY